MYIFHPAHITDTIKVVTFRKYSIFTVEQNENLSVKSETFKRKMQLLGETYLNDLHRLHYESAQCRKLCEAAESPMTMVTHWAVLTVPSVRV